MTVARSRGAEEAMAQTHAQAASRVIGPTEQSGVPEIVFYQLGRKFVDDEREIPKESADVLYYTLAVGHHTGIMDCFDEKLRCSMDVYERVLGLFDEGSDARYKLEGMLRSGEIQVDASHLDVLEAAVAQAKEKACEGGEAYAREAAWLEGFSTSLSTVRKDPVVYLMGRVRQ